MRDIVPLVINIHVIMNRLLFNRIFYVRRKQGRIHGSTVADGLAGAVISKNRSLFEKVTGRTDRPTEQSVESRVRD